MGTRTALPLVRIKPLTPFGRAVFPSMREVVTGVRVEITLILQIINVYAMIHASA